MKEEFCGACAAGVAALVGAGAAGSSTIGDRKKNKKKKKILLYVGVSIAVLSILVAIYILCFKKCSKECE